MGCWCQAGGGDLDTDLLGLPLSRQAPGYLLCRGRVWVLFDTWILALLLDQKPSQHALASLDSWFLTKASEPPGLWGTPEAAAWG